MRHLASLFVVVAVVLLSSLAVVRAQEASPTSNDPAAMHAAFVAAIQANDADAFAALFAPEGVLVTPFGVFRGREEIQGFQAGLIANNPDLAVTFTEPTVTHNTAVSRDEVSAETWRAAGAERIIIIHTLVVANGQIVVLANIPDIDDPVTRAFFTPMEAAAATPAA
jgi:uncharacterized protein (TIGR02246 family)